MNLKLFKILIFSFLGTLLSCSNDSGKSNIQTPDKLNENVKIPSNTSKNIGGTYKYGKYGKAIIVQKGNQLEINFSWSNPKNNTSYVGKCKLNRSNFVGTVQEIKPKIGKRDSLKGEISSDFQSISLKGSGTKYGFNKIVLKKL